MGHWFGLELKQLNVNGGPSGGSCVRRPGSEDPHRRERKFLSGTWYELQNINVCILYISQRWYNILWIEFESSWTRHCLIYYRQTQLMVELGCGNRERWPPSAWATKRAAMTSLGVSKIIFNPLIILHLIVDTGAMTAIGVRKFGSDNIVQPKEMQILCILEQANFPLNASVCRLP